MRRFILKVPVLKDGLRLPFGHPGRLTVFFIILVRATASCSAQVAAADSQADSGENQKRLIEAVASRNKKPQDVHGKGIGSYILFDEAYDWTDHARVEAAVWTLSQHKSNTLWQRLFEHLDDNRYSFALGEEGLWAELWPVGGICRIMARNQMKCAYLQYLVPGKTMPMGGDSSNFVRDGSNEFLPHELQLELHQPRQLGERFDLDPPGSDAFRSWCKERKGKLLFELQIEMCEWAVKVVENAKDVPEEPKNNFLESVRKQIEVLKTTKTPVVDHSVFASPIYRNEAYPFDAAEAKQAWKNYHAALKKRDERNRNPKSEEEGDDGERKK